MFRKPSKKLVPINVPYISDLGLAPKTTARILDSIRKDFDNPSISNAELDEQDEQDEESEMDIELLTTTDIEILPINLSMAMHAPIAAVVELQKIYVIERNIIAQLMKKSRPGKPHPQLLGYLKESTNAIKEIYKMTEGEQVEENIEKLKVVRAMFDSDPELSEDFKIQFLKQMRNKAKAAATQ